MRLMKLGYWLQLSMRVSVPIKRHLLTNHLLRYGKTQSNMNISIIMELADDGDLYQRI